ncbi:MAG: hemerythrin domain-containing protein [Pseudomonadota bacterium]|nr:MAG: hemerythrin domain-containing protein [Pseudomonadota bacterium]
MIADTLIRDHRDCDAHYARAESAAGQGDAEQARQAHAAFAAALERHMSAEEEVLFPAFEEMTGMEDGPTAVMRMEHDQMRSLLAQMSEALDGGDLDGYLDGGETLNVLVQQHNMKEENMLYPMCEQALGDQADELIARMQP